MITIPWFPSTFKNFSSLILFKPSYPIPTTQGIPNSLATMAVCDNNPPKAVTTPPTFVRTFIHSGDVKRDIKILPSCHAVVSSTVYKNFASPSISPADAGRPFINPFSDIKPNLYCWDKSH